MKKPERLKKSLAVLVILLAIGLPLACTTNNSTNPTSPITIGGSPTNTPSGPTATFTPTFVLGATATFTPTYIATPVWLNDVSLSAQPNGMYCQPGTSVVMVATGEVTAGGDVTMLESYVAGGAPYASTQSNFLWVGIPTPSEGPVTFSGRATKPVLSNPQGLAYSLGTWAILDSPGAIGVTGTTTLYEGDNVFGLGVTQAFRIPIENVTTDYGGSTFSRPQALAADTSGRFYVADTGNKRITEFGGAGYVNVVGEAAWRHFWTGSSTYNFRNPVAVACDLSDNVYVGDTGVSGSTATSPSVVLEFTAEGEGLVGSWTLIPNCIINGLAVDGNNHIYVSDVGNGIGGAGQVEEYDISGANPILLRVWGDPKGTNEFAPFYPSCITLVGNASLTTPLTNILVGDQNNDMIQVFGP